MPPEEPAPAVVKADAVPGRAGPGRAYGLALAAGAVGGVVAWLGGEAIHGWFEAPLFDSFNPRSREMGGLVRTAAIREGLLGFGMLGAALGLALGLAGGLVRRSVRAALGAGGLGLALAAAAGAGAAAGLVPYFLVHVNRDADDLLLPLLIHAGIWAPIGAAAGLAYGGGFGGRRGALSALLGGLLGALIGTLVFEVVAPFAFPLAKTGEPISVTPGSRLFARLVIALFTAAGAVLATQAPAPASKPTPATEL
jgi:hypothetical protein